MKVKSKSAGALSLLPRFRVMRGKEIAFGPGKMELLERVAETGSISEAAKRMEMSYMRAWKLIQTMNACFKEPVIETVRGGHERGGAKLTETGQRVLESYQRMEKVGLKAVQSDWQALQKLLRAK
jgi:molybdate transport system regulatory protein